MMKQFIEKHKDLITIALAFVALIISGYSLFRSCSSESELREINYSINSIEYRPKIKLTNPRIKTFSFTSDSITPKLPTNNDSIGTAFGKIDFGIELNAINIGNSTAKIFGWIIADTLSNEPFLKNYIKNKKITSTDSDNELKFPHYYQELNPFDSCKIELKYTPQWIENNKFIIHVLLHYENELDQLFDTYYWLTVETKEPIFPNPLFFRNNPEKLKEYKLVINDIAEIKDQNNYSEPYTKEERKIIIDKID